MTVDIVNPNEPKWVVRTGASAEREMSKLTDEMFDRVSAAISELATDPSGSGTVKLKGWPGRRKSAGDYRVVYEVDKTERKVVVRHVRHRSEVYKRLR
jgi:mRNA interferase RelE/StbE